MSEQILYVSHIGGVDHPYSLYHEHSGMAIQVAKGDPRDDMPVVAAPFTGKPEQTWVSMKGIDGFWFINEATGTYLTLVQGTDGKAQVRAQLKAPMEWLTPESTQGIKIHHEINLIPVDKTFGAGGIGLAWTSLDADGGKKLDVANYKDTRDTDWTLRGSQGSVHPTEFYKDAPERAKIINNVKNCIAALNVIVQILDNPEQEGDDLIDLSYDQTSIERFKARGRECAANLELARRTASRWAGWTAERMNEVASHLSSIKNEQKNAAAEEKSLEAERTLLEKELPALEAPVKIREAEVAAAREKHEQAETKAKATAAEEEQYRNLSGWARIWADLLDAGTSPVSAGLKNHTYEMLKRDAKDAEWALKQAQQALMDVQRPYNESKLKLEMVLNKVALVKDTLKQLDTKKLTLEQCEEKVKTETQSIKELSTKLEECLHAVSGASVSAGHTAQPTMMSLTLVGENIQELRKQLMADKEKDFEGALMELDTARLESLSKRIKAIDM